MRAGHDRRAFILRYGGATLAALTGQCLVVTSLLRRQRALEGAGPAPFPSLADLITLSRAAAGAHALGLVAAARDGSTRVNGPLLWAPLLAAVTVADWADGWCARSRGEESAAGAILDLETDSWLTVCAACAATTVGELPPSVVLAPLARGALFWLAPAGDAGLPYRHHGAWWERASGTAQMALLLGSLLQRSPAGKRALRRLTGPVTLLSTVSLVAQWLPLLPEGGEHADRQAG